jgi:hypothetical protein
MGAALFIVLEREIHGLDTTMDGKCLSLATEKLDTLAAKLRVTPLSEFFSTDPTQAAEFLDGEGLGDSEVPIPPLRQFTAEQGLATVRALLTHIGSQPASVPDFAGVVRDLQDCERILSSAAAQGVGWHMEVDF